MQKLNGPVTKTGWYQFQPTADPASHEFGETLWVVAVFWEQGPEDKFLYCRAMQWADPGSENLYYQPVYMPAGDWYPIPEPEEATSPG